MVWDILAENEVETSPVEIATTNNKEIQNNNTPYQIIIKADGCSSSVIRLQLKSTKNNRNKNWVYKNFLCQIWCSTC